MFERQIGYDLAGKKQSGRSPYFGFSVGLVSMLFASFLVASIFADDFSLSGENLEMTSMLALTAASEPEETEPDKPTTTPSHSNPSAVPTRTALVARVDEPQLIPDKIGVEASKVPPMPKGSVLVDNFNYDPPTSGTSRPDGPGASDTSARTFGPKDASTPKVNEIDRDLTPPPVDRKPRYIGVVTSKATFLPKPPYPEMASRLGLSGSVTVQVVIDEKGRVVSANASNGNMMFRDAAERAARQAKFTPTYLSDVPIKVTGIIVYHFNR